MSAGPNNDAEAAASGSSDEADSPDQSSGGASSDLSSGDSDSATSSKSELHELEEEEEMPPDAKLVLDAPRAKRRRATPSMSQHDKSLSQASRAAGAVLLSFAPEFPSCHKASAP